MIKPEISVANMRIAGGLVLALAFALALHGAVPFVAVPTLGQAVWTTGFSQSFVNESLLSVYAKNFGAPEPAAISFGLAGAHPAGLFIALGLHPVDAYAAMAALWLSVAFLGAWCFGIQLGVKPSLSIVSALVWVTMPVVWAHAGYSMVSFGMALLPFYFLAALRVLSLDSAEWMYRTSASLFFAMACIIAVFMDGYSFMMFAVGLAVLSAFTFVRMPQWRHRLLTFAFPVYATGFILGYVLYAFHIARLEFTPSPLSFFRDWGADLSFFVLPTKGIHWFWDVIGWSVARSERVFFGDRSVWTTTFSLPLIVAGLAAWFFTRSHNRLATGFLLVALIGLYMSLGPTLKINATRPEALIHAGEQSGSRPLEFVAPTGSGWLSTHVPGLRSMRTAYRWIALATFGLWALLLLLLARAQSPPARALAIVGLAILVLSNLPHPGRAWFAHIANRDKFLALDRELVGDMRGVLHRDELVAFVPYGYDILANYLAARLKIKTYNIGGDKNLELAREHWPSIMHAFQMEQIDPDFASRVLSLLLNREADVVVLPYISLRWGAHDWPAPNKFEQDLEPVLRELAGSSLVDVDRRRYYAVVRLSKPPSAAGVGE